MCIGAGIGAVLSGSVYALTHRDDFDWGDFASATAQGAAVGAVGGFLAPAGTALATQLGLQGGRALGVAVVTDAAIGAGLTWAINTALCQPTTPTDLLVGALTGGLGNFVRPGVGWLKGLFGNSSDPALRGANPYIPHGFASADEYDQFTRNLYDDLNDAGYGGSATAVFQGSSVTGQSFRTGQPFRPEGDYDIALAGDEVLERARKAGVGLRSGGTRTGPLRDIDLRKMRLSGLAEELSERAGRDVHFMIYGSVESATGRGPSIIAPRK
ncbi:hypothetical protein [Streptomyces sp. WAC 04229]|uniref:hypothetical protein n=1 Tax=Streptomyces sp. WAC 04229 TaxID=2203206 RepID=UPI003D7528C1